MGEQQLRQRIKIIKGNLQFAQNCDWYGQVIYCENLLFKYEELLLDIVFFQTDRFMLALVE